MKSESVLLAIDQGTTSSRAILFTSNGEILKVAQKELTLHYPEQGWVEQDANDIWQDVLEVSREVIENEPYEIAALGITNQRETTIIWDKITGKPIYNAIVWQDRRTANFCEELKKSGCENQITKKTGLLIDPYFCASKICWILEHIAGAREKAEAGDLLFGTVESYLVWHLTAGKKHVSDASNASRTLLFNIHQQCWDQDLLKLFDIPQCMLPEVIDNISDIGQTDKSCFQKRIPIASLIGDQQSALVGQACLSNGGMKSTYGTGCFMLMHTGTEVLQSKNRLLATTAYRINGEVYFALEGSIFVAGSAIQWLRDGLGIIQNAAETESLAMSVESNDGVYFVPALTGLGAPYWQPDARGLFTGITRGTQKAHFVRAALEAQAYQTRDLVEAMVADGAKLPSRFRVDGGLVTNKFVCQFLADVLQVEVEVPMVTEATAWGAASLAGLQVGVFKSVEDMAENWRLAAQYKPLISQAKANQLYEGWKQAVSKVLA